MLSALGSFSALASAQSEAERVTEQAQQRAVVELWEALVPLQSVNAFMNTGAHPDDERSSLLAYLSREVGAQVISVTANRGEGGQNAIGTEYEDALGVLRSREMEEASRAFGVDLYFLSEGAGSPIYDFGFSKTPEETFAQWGEQETLRRLVRVIRESRPDVLFTSFLDVHGQHGHHRAMTQATVAAFDLAADPNAFPGQLTAGLRPWQVKKLYLPAESGAGSTYADAEPPPPVTLEVEVGDYDTILGATYEQLGEQSRVFHQSQGMGSWHAENPSTVSLHLLHSRVNRAAGDTAVFDDLPNTVGDLADGVSDAQLARLLRGAQEHLEAAVAGYPDYVAVAASVRGALAEVRAARGRLPEAGLDEEQRADLAHRLRVKETQLQNASAKASLLIPRLEVAEVEEGAPENLYELTRGGSTTLTLSAYRGGPVGVENVSFDLVAPEGWTVERAGEREDTTLARGETASATFTVTAPEDAPYTDPYRTHVSPYDPSSDLYGVVRFEADGVPVAVTVAPEETLAVLPDVSLEPASAGVIYNTTGPSGSVEVNVTATNHTQGAAETTVSLAAPEGWRVQPREVPLAFSGVGEVQGASFTLTPPESVRPGGYALELRAEGEAASQETVQRVSYPHIGNNYLVTPARVTVQAFPVEVPDGLRVGYVDGGSDRVYEALRQLGVEVTLLDAEAISSGDLSVYDTIVLGIFTYGSRPELAPSNRRLLEYAENGGNLVVQYHRPSDNWDPEAGARAPYYLEIGSPSFDWRVTDENAPVTYLAPEHPLLTTPNEITGADWAGWVKDRGLYFASEWAPELTPLLAMSDPGEEPLRGGLLSADYGQGRYTHSSLIFYYQLENLVPGAYRIFANLITPPGK